MRALDFESEPAVGLEISRDLKTAPPSVPPPPPACPAVRPANRRRHRQDANGQRSAVLPSRWVARAMEMPVLRSLVPLAAGYYASAEFRVDQPPLGRGEALLLYCTKGEGWCEIAGCRHRVASGDLCVIPPEAPRLYGTDTRRGWTISWVHAAGSNLDFFLEQLGTTRKRPLIKVGEDLRLFGWMLELIDLLGPDCETAELLYASQTLAHLLSALACQTRHQRRAGTDVSHRIARTIGYMHQHLAEPVRAATLATVANMSLPHYFALFKRTIGTTPIDYFIKLRMEQARRLLAETPWSIKEIASSLGYEDPLYFSRVFKSVTRATPSNYRFGQSAAR